MRFLSRLQKTKGRVRSAKLLLEMLCDRMMPASIAVTTFADVVDPLDNKVSLREAITSANSADTPVTIRLRPGVYKITLSGGGINFGGDFDLTNSMTIKGSGAGTTIIDTAIENRLFDLIGPINVEFAGLTMRRGQDVNGSAIASHNADVTLTNCIVSDNKGTVAGAIYTDLGTVTLFNSTVLRNVTVGNGGGISALNGSVVLKNSRVIHNLASNDGGGIFAKSVSLTKSTVSRNNAGSDGGGIFVLTDATLVNSSIVGNRAILDNGGGISAGNSVSLIKSAVRGNGAGVSGGGITAVSNVTVSFSSVCGNSADLGGGIYSSGTTEVTRSIVKENVALDDGGGILSFDLRLTSSTISNNTSASSGGGFSGTIATIANSTISGNFAAVNGGGISAIAVELVGSTVSDNAAGGVGGGIASDSVYLYCSTISGNSADLEGGGIHAMRGEFLNATITENTANTGGGVYRANNLASFAVMNTIIAQNIDFTSVAPDAAGVFDNFGHNLIGIINGSSGLASIGSTNIFGTFASPLDARLGPLQFNGGPTQTHGLRAGSLAINGGDNAVQSEIGPILTDQRGKARRKGPFVDIGAFEK